MERRKGKGTDEPFEKDEEEVKKVKRPRDRNEMYVFEEGSTFWKMVEWSYLLGAVGILLYLIISQVPFWRE